MTWLATAKEFTDAAERARQDGNTVASIVLAVKAAECIKIAKLLGEGEVRRPAPSTEGGE